MEHKLNPHVTLEVKTFPSGPRPLLRVKSTPFGDGAPQVYRGPGFCAIVTYSLDKPCVDFHAWGDGEVITAGYYRTQGDAVFRKIKPEEFKWEEELEAATQWVQSVQKEFDHFDALVEYREHLRKETQHGKI